MENVEKLKVAIIDYKMSNLFSVKHACDYIGVDAEITSDYKTILNSDSAILPGVGAFAEAMYNLKKLDLISPIKEFIKSNKPFMGICLGLQLLFTESEEFGINKGLDVVPGRVVKFKNFLSNGKRIKVPNVGWEQIYSVKNSNNSWSNSPFKDVKEGEYMYFVHSFYVIPNDNSYVLSNTQYGETNFCSSIKKNNLFAVQFHPEKSSKEGIKIYTQWKNSILESKEIAK